MYIFFNDFVKFSSVTKYDMTLIEKNIQVELTDNLVSYKSKNNSKNITAKYLSNEFYWKVLGTKNNDISNRKY